MLHTPKEVREFTGLNYRHLQYWDETGLVVPERDERNRRKYSSTQVLMLKILKELRQDWGVPLQRLRPLSDDLKFAMKHYDRVSITDSLIIIGHAGPIAFVNKEVNHKTWRCFGFVATYPSG